MHSVKGRLWQPESRRGGNALQEDFEVLFPLLLSSRSCLAVLLLSWPAVLVTFRLCAIPWAHGHGGQSRALVTEQEDVSDSAREKMSSGLKDKCSRSPSLCGRSCDVQSWCPVISLSSWEARLVRAVHGLSHCSAQRRSSGHEHRGTWLMDTQQTPCKPLLSQPLQQLFKELNLNINFKGGLNYLQFCITTMLSLKARVSMRIVQILFLLLQTKEPLIPNEWLNPPSMLSCLNMEILVSICFHYLKKEELLFQFFFLNFNREKKKLLDGDSFLFSQEKLLLCVQHWPCFCNKNILSGYFDDVPWGDIIISCFPDVLAFLTHTLSLTMRSDSKLKNVIPSSTALLSPQEVFGFCSL